MKVDVMKFNRVRNGFELDYKLELDMLQEEVKEAFDSETLAELIDACVDIEYVLDGTKQKLLYNRYDHKSFLVDYAETAIKYIYEMINEYLYKFDFLCMTEDVMDKATGIVAEINAMKISELDENGKVMKQPDLPNATEAIAKMLNDDLGISYEAQRF